MRGWDLRTTLPVKLLTSRNADYYTMCVFFRDSRCSLEAQQTWSKTTSAINIYIFTNTYLRFAKDAKNMSTPQVNVLQCDIQISKKELGLTRDKYTTAMLRQRLFDKIRASGRVNQGPFPVVESLQDIVDDFAEKGAAGAISNLNNYFSKRIAAGYTAGGRRATSKALLYTRDQFHPSSNDIGAVGEGIAGYYLENMEGLSFEIRPFDVSPDMIFREPSTGGVILVEVKSSLEAKPNIGGVVGVAISLLDVFAKTKFIRRYRYLAYVVVVRILSINSFEVYRLRMEEI